MIAVVDYGIGNLRSAEKALQHLGADARAHRRPRARSSAADAVVLPGRRRTSARACRRCARAASKAATRAAATDGRPFLGICIGMQMLFDGSDETPGVAGPRRRARPGDAAARRRCGSRRWGGTRSSVSAGVAARSPACPIPRGCYFVHSYAPEPDDDGVVAAWCDYGRRFAAAVERGPLWATQFHPEKTRRRRAARCSRNFVEAVAAVSRWISTRRSTCAAGGSCACCAATTTRDRLRRRSGRGRARVSTPRARAGSTSSISTRRATAATRTSAVIEAICANVDVRRCRPAAECAPSPTRATGFAAGRRTGSSIGSAAVEHPEVVDELRDAAPGPGRGRARRARSRRRDPRLDRRDRARPRRRSRGGSTRCRASARSSSPTSTATACSTGPDVEQLAAVLAAVDDAGDRERRRRDRSTTCARSPRSRSTGAASRA